MKKILAAAAAAALAAPGAAVAPTERVITEHALYDDSGEVEQGLFSHTSESLVRTHAAMLLAGAHANGRPLPDLRLVKRVCTFPLRKDGSMIHDKSTVVETETEI